MISVKTEFRATPQNVISATNEANFKNLAHAAASLRKTAADSIQRAPQGVASRPGTPPNTHRRVFYRRALRFHVDKQREEAIMGFRASIVGDVGHAHEFGARRGNQVFPERPTVGPALDKSAARLGDQWRGSIGS